MVHPIDKSINWFVDSFKKSSVLTLRQCAIVIESINGQIAEDMDYIQSCPMWKFANDPQIWPWESTDVNYFFQSATRRGLLEIVLVWPKPKPAEYFTRNYRADLQAEFDELKLQQLKARQRVLFMKARKSRSPKRNFAYIRIPHL